MMVFEIFVLGDGWMFCFVVWWCGFFGFFFV